VLLDIKIAMVARALLPEAIADPEFPFSVMPKRHGELKEYSIGPSKGSTANYTQVNAGCTEVDAGRAENQKLPAKSTLSHVRVSIVINSGEALELGSGCTQLIADDLTIAA
jgi:hypothetical protein